VTNVAAFGAFVDVGVHQDGLVHVSQLANQYVNDPHEIVKPGQIVKVKVMEVDEKRQRISLTMRLDEPSNTIPRSKETSASTNAARGPNRPEPKPGGAFALALERARTKNNQEH
jgi:uncharacterized protein